MGRISRDGLEVLVMIAVYFLFYAGWLLVAFVFLVSQTVCVEFLAF